MNRYDIPIMHVFDAYCEKKMYGYIFSLQMFLLLSIDGWQRWSIPLTAGSKWADASASDVGSNRLTRKTTIATQLS